MDNGDVTQKQSLDLTAPADASTQVSGTTADVAAPAAPTSGSAGPEVVEGAYEVTGDETEPKADEPLTMDVLDRKLEEIRVQIVAAFSEDQVNALLSKLQEELTAHMQTIDESMNAFLREHVDPLREQIADLRNSIALPAPTFVPEGGSGGAGYGAAGGAGGAANSDLDSRVRVLEAKMKFM